MFGAYEVQFAASVLRLQPGLGAEELLALAVAARAPRFGHVCTPLDSMAVRLAELDGEEMDDLPWPTADAWADSLDRSDIVAPASPAADGPVRPLVWDADRLYLQRYWYYELAIADDLARRCAPAPPWRIEPGSGPTRGPGGPGARLRCSGRTDPVPPTCSGWPPDGRWLPACRSSPEGRERVRPTRWPGSWPPPTWWRPSRGVPSRWPWPPPPARRRPAWARRSRPRRARSTWPGGPGDVAALVAATAPTTIHSLLGLGGPHPLPPRPWPPSARGHGHHRRDLDGVAPPHGQTPRRRPSRRLGRPGGRSLPVGQHRGRHGDE